jgi:hypothetical protein
VFGFGITDRRPINIGSKHRSTTTSSSAGHIGQQYQRLVQNKKGVQYILSNNHVLAKTNKGIISQRISQPGLIDTDCSPILDDVVANISNYVPISFTANNKVDAAIARVRKDCLDQDNNLVNRVDPTGRQVKELLRPLEGSRNAMKKPFSRLRESSEQA